IFPALIASLGLLVAGVGHAESVTDANAAADARRFERWIHAGLLDPDAPMEQRKAIVAELEALAKDDSDPGLLYLLGSLYRQDPAHSSSPVAQDLNRARILLSRAALHGKIPAMAKLSTIELQAGFRFEANVWAQLYYHYAKDQAKADPRWTSGFAASILRNALDGFPEQEIKALNASVEAMLTQYDAQIRQGLSKISEAGSNDRFRDARPGKRVLLNAEDTRGRRLESGMSEYVVEFSADGSVKQLWTIDAWPNPRLARILRQITLGYRISSDVADEAAGMVAIVPVAYSDGRYKIRDEAETN
ncbi:MAG: hypothetical protein ABIR27_11285, partial [Dokdonella sp.]